MSEHQTKIWEVERVYDPSHPSIQEAAQLISAGKRVAFPTETVYGLGADARSTEAVEGIYTAKGRPSDNPLIVHISQQSQLDALVERVDEISLRLMGAFWPGPLTVILPVKAGAVSPRVTAGLATVAVRMPDHPTALSLITAAGCPVAAPSANRSGRPSPTTAAHVYDDLAGRIEGILDAGPTGVGLESTVVEAAGGRIHVLRPGGISVEQLQAALPDCVVVAPSSAESPAGGVEHATDSGTAPKSPGMKYAHYAPRGRLTVVRGASEARVTARIRQELEQARLRGERTGVLTCQEHADRYSDTLIVPCGSLAQPESIARELFAALRRFDNEGITFIVAEAFDEAGIGLAVMNRLLKAAGQQIINVP